MFKNRLELVKNEAYNAYGFSKGKFWGFSS